MGRGSSSVSRVPNIETPARTSQGSAISGPDMPDVREFGSWGRDFLGDNREGETLQSAINSVAIEKPRGGSLYLPPGDARVFVPPTFKGLSNFSLMGAGGSDGSGGLAGEAGATTRLIYSGLGERAFDWRLTHWCNSVGVAYLTDNPAFTGNVIDMAAGKENRFDYYMAQVTSTTGTIPAAIGLFLAQASSCRFGHGTIKGGAFNVVGRLEGAQTSVANRFDDTTFVGAATLAVLNPHSSWTFNGTIWEPTFTNKGVEIGAGSIGKTLACEALTLIGTWMGGTTIAGTHVTWGAADSGLTIMGSTLATATTGILVEGKPVGITLLGNRFIKCTKPKVEAEAATRRSYGGNTFRECGEEFAAVANE